MFLIFWLLFYNFCWCPGWCNILVLFSFTITLLVLANLYLTQVCFMSNLLKPNQFQIIELEPRLATNVLFSTPATHQVCSSMWPWPAAGKYIASVVTSAPRDCRYRDVGNLYTVYQLWIMFHSLLASKYVCVLYVENIFFFNCNIDTFFSFLHVSLNKITKFIVR